MNAITKQEENQETTLGLLPRDWNVVKLGDVVNTRKGRKPSVLKESFEVGCYAYLTANYFRTLIPSQFAVTKGDKNCIMVDEEDIIFIWDGSNAGDVFTGLKGVLASTMVVIHPKTNKLIKKLLYYFLKTKFELFNEKTTGSTIPHVSKTIYENLDLPLPPLPEQQNIAYVLSTVQEAQHATERAINSLKVLKKSLMKHLFTYGAVSFEDAVKVKLKETEIGKVPDSWKDAKVKNYCKQILTGGTPRTEIKNYYFPQEIKWIKSGEVQGGRIKNVDTYISKKGLENSNARILPKNSVVIALAGRGKTRGTTAILDVECACNQSVICIVPNNEMNTEFLHYHLANIYNYIRNLTGDKDRTGLNKEIVGNLPIFIPQKLEQQQIALILSSLDEKIETEEKRKLALMELFNSLLKNLMTAKIRVKDLKVAD